jgi:membrane peptidoglycan carboxypeptidase
LQQQQGPPAEETALSRRAYGAVDFVRTRSRRRRQATGRSYLLPLALGGVFAAGVFAAAIAFALGVVALFVAEKYEGYTSGVTDTQGLLSRLPQGGSRVYDRHGRLLYEWADAGLRRPVPLNEISPWMVKATIATEDNTFWTNNGLNVQGLARAGVENFSPWQDAGLLEGSGGSSITQQLAKNVYISPEERVQRTIERKMKESALALELTERYSKEQILEWYLNSISYGGLYVGVESAAQGYFAKSAKDLTIAEAALLAGIPQRPAAYEPVNNLEAALVRQREVLDLMVRHGFATVEEVAEARSAEIVARPPQTHVLAPHFVFGPLAREIEAKFGADALTHGGLDIVTTLDLDLQQEGEQVLERWISEYERVSGGNNGALYALDAATGQVLVYVGSRDYFRDDIDGRNDNIEALNSPGSTLKPFTYLTAFQKGWNTGTAIPDVPMQLRDPTTGVVYEPRNPIKSFQGLITVEKALGNSLNIPAVQAIQFAGVNETAQNLRRFGFTTIDSRPNAYGVALTVGGVDITLEDLVYGYSVFATGGLLRGTEATVARDEIERQVDPSTILKVTNAQGEVVYEFENPVEQRVIPPSYAYLITSILSNGNNQCLVFGVCGALNLPGRPSAQKTGTSEPFEGTQARTLIGDTWAVGYTPQLVAGTWFGNSDNRPMGNILSTSVSWRTWQDFMVKAHEKLNISPQQFERPSTVVEREVCYPSGKLPTDACPTARRYKALFAAEQLEGPQPVALKDDWWQRTPGGGVRLVLPPEWRSASGYLARLGIGGFSVACVPPTPGPDGRTPPDRCNPSATPTPTAAPALAQTGRAGSETFGAAASAPRAIRGGGSSVSLATPWSGATVRGSVPISGTASTPNLAQVVVEVSNGSGWKTVAAVSGAGVNGVSTTWASWSTAGLPNGAYALRVTAIDAGGENASTIAAVVLQN